MDNKKNQKKYQCGKIAGLTSSKSTYNEDRALHSIAFFQGHPQKVLPANDIAAVSAYDGISTIVSFAGPTMASQIADAIAHVSENSVALVIVPSASPDRIESIARELNRLADSMKNAAHLSPATTVEKLNANPNNSYLTKK